MNFCLKRFSPRAPFLGCQNPTEWRIVRIGTSSPTLRTKNGGAFHCPAVGEGPGEGGRTWEVPQSDDFVIPVRLVRAQQKRGNEEACKELTVYTVRFSTSTSRSSSLTDPLSGVWLCLISETGAALLHRVPPVFDPDGSERELHELCALANVDMGADCKAAMHESNARTSNKQIVTSRFLQGAIDEVCFLGPELGRLVALLVGPESGLWNPNDVTVSSSRTMHTDRFICNSTFGGVGAAFYGTPVPPDAVVYGEGRRAAVLTRQQAAEIRKANLEEYTNLKYRLLVTTGGFVVVGTLAAALAFGENTALLFGEGGSVGFFYQWLLQQSVDAVGQEEESKDVEASDAVANLASLLGVPSTERLFKSFVGNRYFRYAVLAGGAALFMWTLRDGSIEEISSIGDSASDVAHLDQIQKLLTGLAGFFMYKLAVIFVALGPENTDQRALLLQKDE